MNDKQQRIIDSLVKPEFAKMVQEMIDSGQTEQVSCPEKIRLIDPSDPHGCQNFGLGKSMGHPDDCHWLGVGR